MPDESRLEEFLDELAANQVKHDPQEILAIAKLPDGSIVFLETGNSLAGWRHILEKHGEDFQRRDVSIDNIIDFLFKALETGQIIGIQGTSRRIYPVEYQGKIQYISIDIGSNGYLVSANPAPRKLIRRFSGENFDGP